MISHMNPWLLPAAAAGVLFLTAIAVSLFVLNRSKAMVKAADARTAAGRAILEQRIEALHAQLEALREEPPIAVPTGPIRPGMNLSKRTQALRMHRRGDQPEQIAAALEVPEQEVELLLKVHRIVLSVI